jgi:hypothetical protein
MDGMIKDSNTYNWLVEILDAVHDLLLMVCPLSKDTCDKLLSLATAAFTAKVKARLKQATNQARQAATKIKQATNAKFKALLDIGNEFFNKSKVTQVISHATIVLISVKSDKPDIEIIKRHASAATEVMEHVTVETLREEINALSNFARSALISRPYTQTQGV